MKERMKEFLQNVLANEDHEATWFLDLETRNGKRWALVAAWNDEENNGDLKVYAKLAYQPTNYLMQEYDIDWIMPYDEETGEVDDTELSFVKGSVVSEADVSWFVSEWEYFKLEYVYKEDNDYDE